MTQIVEESKESSATEQNYIVEIPQELLMEIFKFLDVGTFLKTCPVVCKEWNNIV